MSPPWLLLSDVHLGASPRPEREKAVVQLLAAFPGMNVAFVGDLFEFAGCRAREPRQALGELLTANPNFTEALRRHAQSGAVIHWVAGNHDAAVAALESDVSRLVGAPVHVWTWFLRFGCVHLEHGHVFDRDNAPLHPLAPWRVKDEPLGVALMREIVLGLDIPAWAHAHQTTPAQALSQARDWFGWRLPSVAARAFGVLIALNGRAWAGRWGRVSAARALGDARLTELIPWTGLDADTLTRLVRQTPTATHATGFAVFRRLYLDWLASAAITTVGPAVGVVTRSAWPWAGVALAACYAGYEGYLRQGSRYPSPLAALREGAHRIADVTGAKRVVFGHTHVEEDDGVYANLGSFGYPTAHGRAYAVVTQDGAFSRKHLV